MLGVELVPLFRQLQVFNIGQTSRDSLMNYLENTKRSGGSGDVVVNIFKIENYALATFENHDSEFPN